MIIKNGYVVTMDEELKVIRDGAVVFDEDRIIEVGKTTDVLKKHHDDEVLDAKCMMVLPGFVNTHNHLYQTIMRGLGDDGDGMRPAGYRWDIDLLRGLDKEACYASGIMSMVGGHAPDDMRHFGESGNDKINRFILCNLETHL